MISLSGASCIRVRRMECAVKKGFFTLRDCLAATQDACGTCGRPCCAEHARRRDADLLCVECFHKSSAERPPTEDDTWIFAYRQHYYRSSGYHPFYSGSHPDPYYDAYDLRAFTYEGHEDLDDDDRGDFADS